MKRNITNMPAVHKKVKKKDMLFEYILIGILVVFLIYMVIDVCNFFPLLTSKIGITSVGGAVVALYALIWQLHSAIKANKILATIDIETSVDENYVTLSCIITNSGTKSIYPYLTNLYISEGIEEKTDEKVCKYRFEAITEHQIDRSTGECFDCRLAQFCKEKGTDEFGTIEFPSCKETEFQNTMRYCCNLRQLSYFSLVHIMPKESFREDVVVKIDKPGVYRAFVIYTGKEWNDCICTTKIFRIKEKSK